MGFVDWLLGSATFIPHGVCLAWRPDLVALHIGSDIIIALAYFMIPVGIWAFVRRRTDLKPEHRRVAVLFSLFITACGLTHVLGVVTLYSPIYGAQGLVKAATALVSLVTAVAIWPLIPRLLEIPSPERLQTEIDAHRATLAELEAARDGLERQVSERTASLHLAMSEMNHRAKNLLTITQSIARQTAPRTEEGRAYVEAFGRRLRALAGAHDELVRADWKGVDLGAVARGQLHYQLDAMADRISIVGPDVALGPESAHYFGLALHELGTNAVKHGALSNAEGRVDLIWSLEDGRLRLSWRERGGPPADAPGAGGFGRVLLERLLPRSLGGEAELRFEPEGLVYELRSGLLQPSAASTAAGA